MTVTIEWLTDKPTERNTDDEMETCWLTDESSGPGAYVTFLSNNLYFYFEY